MISPMEGKRSDGFDLQSSSFPPLPTATSVRFFYTLDLFPSINQRFFQEQGDTLVNAVLEPSTTTRPSTQPSTTQLQQVSQRVENSPKEQTTVAATPVSSATAKIRPRMQQSPTIENVNGCDYSKRHSESVSPPANHQPHHVMINSTDEEQKQMNCSGTTRNNKSSETTKLASPFSSHDAQMRDQKMAHKPIVSATTATGGVIRSGTNTTIPIAVVVPNAQPKPPRYVHFFEMIRN